MIDFTSTAFQFVFLPLVLIGFWSIQTRAPRWSVPFLVLSSVIFLGANSLFSLSVLLCCAGITRLCSMGFDTVGRRRAVFLAAGIGANLLILVWFKLHPIEFDPETSAMLAVGMPLGLSFYAFKQITYLVDRHQDRAPDLPLKDYALFSIFFAHLPAGPITPYKALQPQIAALSTLALDLSKLAAGLSLYTIGVFKYTVFARQLGNLTAPIYDAAEAGKDLCFPEAVVGSFGFLLQLYYDFSAYSDMAIGIALCFGLVLSPNFDSPLKASCIGDYVLRWHMSLMVFARDYVFRYVQSVLARFLPFRSAIRRRIVAWGLATCLTFFLVMVWHDAGWLALAISLCTAFLVVAGGLARARRSRRPSSPVQLPRIVGVAACVVIASITIVFFRAPDLATALGFFSGFAKLGALLNGTVVAQVGEICPVFARSPEYYFLLGVFMIATLSVFLMPNTMRVFGILPSHPALRFKPGLVWAIMLGILVWLTWMMSGQITRGFIYERF